jgi:hypothetical protein
MSHSSSIAVGFHKSIETAGAQTLAPRLFATCSSDVDSRILFFEGPVNICMRTDGSARAPCSGQSGIGRRHYG